MEAGPEVPEDLVRRQFGSLHPFSNFRLRAIVISDSLCHLGEACAVGNLLAKLVTFLEDLAHETHNVVSVGTCHLQFP